MVCAQRADAEEVEPATASEGAPELPPDDPKAKLAELKHLLAEQQASQVVLARKIDEIETLL